MTESRRADDDGTAGTLTDFGPAEFLMEPLPIPARHQAMADDPFAALKALSDDERIALFT